MRKDKKWGIKRTAALGGSSVRRRRRRRRRLHDCAAKGHFCCLTHGILAGVVSKYETRDGERERGPEGGGRRRGNTYSRGRNKMTSSWVGSRGDLFFLFFSFGFVFYVFESVCLALSN